ncbi:hypothetical protein V6N11_074152 [Hibiscus sabdariffa]|uniref:Uncharacterized protein n=1 Tax=Hibiscus sabdariffa TaxID=183260 RepID=A0ABR2NWM3_9ROSI
MEEDLVAVTTHKITDQDTSCPSKTGPEIAKTSYTDMAGKPPILGDGNTAKVNSIDEEVVTFEEDVITIRDGAIPSIQLFDRVHDQVQEEIRDAVLRPKTAGVERSSKGAASKGFQSPLKTFVHEQCVNIVDT